MPAARTASGRASSSAAATTLTTPSRESKSASPSTATQRTSSRSSCITASASSPSSSPETTATPGLAGGRAGEEVVQVDAALDHDETLGAEQAQGGGLPGGTARGQQDRHRAVILARAITTRPSEMPPRAVLRLDARSSGTPTITCRVACGASESAERGTATTTTSSSTSTARGRWPDTVLTFGVTQTSTWDPCRTVAGRSSEATLIGTSTTAGPEPEASAERGRSSPAATSRPSVAPAGMAWSAAR